MKNKIYKVKWNEETDVILAANKKAAIEHCIEYNDLEDEDIKSCEEIPESEWDKKCGVVYEDNNTENEPFDVTYRDLYFENGFPEIMVSTNINWL